MITEIDGRPVYFENDMARQVGMVATCNCCDRVIFEDEVMNTPHYDYMDGGYCPDCDKHLAKAAQEQPVNFTAMKKTFTQIVEESLNKALEYMRQGDLNAAGFHIGFVKYLNRNYEKKYGIVDEARAMEAYMQSAQG